MNKTELRLNFSITKECDGVPVIVVAAGNSTRMQGINKQFISVLGVPVLIRTLMAFEYCDCISGIVLVVKESDIFEMQTLCSKYGISKVTDIVCGGNSRQESVANGLKRLGEDEEYVLIHDGARPLVNCDIITSVYSTLKNRSGVTCAVKVKDTIKEISPDGEVVKTVPRENLVSVQTPQGVRVKDYKKAIADLGDISKFTDDTSIMEAAGFQVFTVEGSYKNIKITTPEDIAVAEAYLKEED